MFEYVTFAVAQLHLEQPESLFDLVDVQNICETMHDISIQYDVDDRTLIPHRTSATMMMTMLMMIFIQAFWPHISRANKFHNRTAESALQYNKRINRLCIRPILLCVWHSSFRIHLGM